MKYYYGNSYKEAVSNNPVEIKSAKVLESYKEVYNVVIPANEIEGEDESQEKQKVWYIKFERQGYDELVVRVEADSEEDAYNKAAWAFIGDTYDIAEATKEQAYAAECPVIDESGDEWTFEDEDDVENEETKEKGND